MACFSAYGFVFGNYNAVIGGMDGAGNICGVSGQPGGDFSDYPYVYISNLDPNNTDAIFSSALCVKFCPVDANIACKHNKLFAKTGTCSNYSALKGATEYTAPYVTENILGYCIPKAECKADALNPG